jgi:hypothetical protein
VEWEDHIDCLDIPIGADLFQEEVLLCYVPDELGRSKCLTGRKRCNCQVILSSSSYGIAGDFTVEGCCITSCNAVVVVEKRQLDFVSCRYIDAWIELTASVSLEK